MARKITVLGTRIGAAQPSPAAPVVNLKRGAIGPAGAAFTIRNTTVSTLAPGAAATVTATPTGTPGQFDLAVGLPKGETGLKGDTGNTGATGAAFSIRNTTVSTLAPGAAATVTATPTGTPGQFDLAVGLPKGDTGLKGDTGNTGATGAAFSIRNTTVSTVAPGADATVTATPTGTPGQFDLAVGLPKGDQGNTGATGAAFTIRNVSVSTLAPGAAATVTATPTGTPGQFDLAVGLPKGDQGNPGATGAAGTNGTNGTNGKTVLTTSGAPSAGAGTDGDFAYDPTAKIMYGPKASGAWPAGVSLQGPQGT
ncbi:MAG: hypothetical protein RL095_2183, partial [Verrucomicrobiota bacterium]